MSTEEAIRSVLVVVAAYVIGSIPFGVVVARLSGGIDPRTIGSGRTGGANTMRAIGPRLALVAGLLDMCKGVAAVLLAGWIAAGTGVEVVAAMAAVIGHSRSMFLGFGGGRGVAPAFGATLAFSPIVALLILPVFAGVILVSRYSSLGSLSGAAFGGLLMALQTYMVPLDPWMYVWAVAGTGLVWLFHWDNIGRLLAGKERKIGAPRPATEPPAEG